MKIFATLNDKRCEIDPIVAQVASSIPVGLLIELERSEWPSCEPCAPRDALTNVLRPAWFVFRIVMGSLITVLSYNAFNGHSSQLPLEWPRHFANVRTTGLTRVRPSIAHVSVFQNQTTESTFEHFSYERFKCGSLRNIMNGAFHRQTFPCSLRRISHRISCHSIPCATNFTLCPARLEVDACRRQRAVEDNPSVRTSSNWFIFWSSSLNGWSLVQLLASICSKN